MASLASGTDREQTIGEMYGGKAGEPGVTDQVYLSLGKVRTQQRGYRPSVLEFGEGEHTAGGEHTGI